MFMFLLFSKKYLLWNFFEKELLIVFPTPAHSLARARATVLGPTVQASVLNAPGPSTSHTPGHHHSMLVHSPDIWSETHTESAWALGTGSET